MGRLKIIYLFNTAKLVAGIRWGLMKEIRRFYPAVTFALQNNVIYQNINEKNRAFANIFIFVTDIKLL